jgi:hypothetical protein
MKVRVTLEIEVEDVEAVRYVLFDAFGEFLARRKAWEVESLGFDDPEAVREAAEACARAYVEDRYQAMSEAFRAEQVARCARRFVIARQLRLASNDAKFEVEVR